MNQFSLRFIALSALPFYLAAILFNYVIFSDYYGHIAFKMVAIPFVIILLGTSVIFALLAYLPISKLHTFRTAMMQFIITGVVYTMGYFSMNALVKATKQVRKAQHGILMDILAKGANSEFGRKMGLPSVKTIEDYQATMPMTTYEDYREYVERIGKGEDNVLSSAKVIKLSVSSGTTGKCKELPLTVDTTKAMMSDFVFPLIYRHMARHPFPLKFALRKSCEIAYQPNWRYSECGIPIGPLSVQHGKKEESETVFFTTPAEAMSRMSEPAQTYIHWLFALMDKEMGALDCGFGGAFLASLEFLQKNWKQLVEDIRHGRLLTNSHEIPAEIAQKIQQMPLFKAANPKRADEIERECLKGFEGIVKRLWPAVSVMSAVCTGAHAIYRDRLLWYGGKGVKLISSFLGASEGIFGIPLTGEQEEKYLYTLLIQMTFFEFIPESEIDKERPQVLLADQLEVGRRYELVMTSHNGFYRYRMGDIVCVRGFFNQTPVVEFCSRVGGILDLRGEKTTEDMVTTALKKAATSKWQGCRQLIEFTVTDCLTFERSCTRADADETTSFGQLYYVVFVELDGVSRELSDGEIEEFDNALCEITFPYKSFRIKNAISEAKVFVVRGGTFAELKRRILVLNNATSNQFKAPRYEKRPEFVRFLFDSAFQG